MIGLLQTATKILTKPRKTAKVLLEKNAINLALWFFLIFTAVSSISVLPLVDSLGVKSVWQKGGYIIGFSLLGSSLSLLIPSILLNLLCRVVRGKCDFKGTLLSMAWTLGPGLLIEVPIAFLYCLLTLSFWNELIMLHGETLATVLYILEQINFLTVFIKIPIQIVFLAEVYKISIFRVVLLHIALILIFVFGWIGFVILFFG